MDNVHGGSSDFSRQPASSALKAKFVMCNDVIRVKRRASPHLHPPPSFHSGVSTAPPIRNACKDGSTVLRRNLLLFPSSIPRAASLCASITACRAWSAVSVPMAFRLLRREQVVRGRQADLSEARSRQGIGSVMGRARANLFSKVRVYDSLLEGARQRSLLCFGRQSHRSILTRLRSPVASLCFPRWALG